MFIKIYILALKV